MYARLYTLSTASYLTPSSPVSLAVIIVSAIFFGAIAAFVYVTESAKKAASWVEHLQLLLPVYRLIYSCLYFLLLLLTHSDKDNELRARGVTVTSSGVAIKLNKAAPTQGRM